MRARVAVTRQVAIYLALESCTLSLKQAVVASRTGGHGVAFLLAFVPKRVESDRSRAMGER